MNVSVLAVVFRRYISKNRQFQGKLHRYLSIALFKTLPYSKTTKTLRNCLYLVKTTLFVDLIFHKLIFFESLIIFPEPTIKLITRIFDLQR